MHSILEYGDPADTAFVSILMVAIHGDEQCGINAHNSLRLELRRRITKGKVLYMVGSPLAARVKIRQIGTDANRLLLPKDQLTLLQRYSLEHTRAQEIRKNLDRSGALLCIHSSIHSSQTPDSPPFVICEDNGSTLANSLPGVYQVSGFDKLCSGSTDAYMNATGKIGICIECGYNLDPKSDKIAAESMLNFLIARGHIEPAQELPSFPKTRVHAHTIYRSRTTSFVHSRDWADFERVSAGTAIGNESNAAEVCAKEDSLILFPDNRDKAGEECFYLARKLES